MFTISVQCDAPSFSLFTGSRTFENGGRDTTALTATNALQRKIMAFVIDAGASADGGSSGLSLRAQETGSVPDFINSRSLPLGLKDGMYYHITIEAEAFEETDKFANLADEQKECFSPEKSIEYRYVRFCYGT